MVMSRAINSRSLSAPNNFILNISDDERESFRGYLDEYTQVNRDFDSTQWRTSTMPSIKLTVRSMYQGVNDLSGEVYGIPFLECNSIINSVKNLNQISAELTLFDTLNSPRFNQQTIEGKLREFNEYTKKLFENINDSSSISQATTYDYQSQTNVENPAYEAFIEWCEEFRDVLKSIGLEDYTPDNRGFWRVEGVLSSTQSWEESKYNLITFFRNDLIKTDYYGNPINPTKLHPMFNKNPLKAISNYLSTMSLSYHDDRFTTVTNALKDVAMANALLAKNPQIMSIGLTELSAYNHRSYYFTAGLDKMTKKNTEFVSINSIPDFTLNHLRRLSNDFKLYMDGFILDSTAKLDEQIKELDELNTDKFKKGKDAVTTHWENIVKHLYSIDAIDELGLLYSNLLFPQTSNYNHELFTSLMAKLRPVQEHYSWREDLGDDYGVSMYIHQNQIQIGFSTPYKHRDYNGDFESEVKNHITSLGVPKYLQQPMRQILTDAREVIDSNSDFELRQVASKIYHIESSRNAGRLRIQEKLQQLHDFKFV